MTSVEEPPEVVAPAEPATTPSEPGRPVRRRLPRWHEVRELVQFRAPVADPVRRRLERALTIRDLRAIARRTTPRAVFDYVDGGADHGVTARQNRAAFRAVTFMPEHLRSVADPDLSTTLFGRTLGLPLVIAPTGYSRMMHHHGEAAVARVAQHNHIPYTLSTVGTSTVEEVRDAAPEGQNWFQLYLTNDRRLNEELVDRALAAGCSALVLTVDTAVAGNRLKDVRNGLTIPPSLSLQTFLDMSRFPSWWLNKLTTPPVQFASLRDFPGSSADVANLMFSPALAEEDLVWLRQRWPRTLLVKGIVNPSDAQRVLAHGVDGIVVSNHGGRQLDQSPATLDVLPAIRDAVGPQPTLLLDSGVTHGLDILAARALGADAVMIGRAYLYGLMAGGERGVQRALDILRAEYQRGMQLVGVNATSKVARHHVHRHR